MVNHRMLYLLASHPKYSHMNKRLANFNVSHNPKQKQLNRSREQHPALELKEVNYDMDTNHHAKQLHLNLECKIIFSNYAHIVIEQYKFLYNPF